MKETLEERIVKSAYSPQSTLVLKDRKSLFSTVHNSFVGSEFLEWLVNMKFVENKEKGMDLANKMLTENDIKSPNKDKTLNPAHCYQFRNLNIVIVGGGCGGLMAAISLQEVLHYDVTVITKQKNFYYTPAIVFAFSGEPIWKKDYETILKKSKIIYNEAAHIEPRRIILKDGRIVEDFDYLIVSTGSHYQDITVKDKKTFVLKGNDSEAWDEHFEQVKKAKNIVVIGSGTVGCEIFGPLCEFNPDKKITMVSMSKTVCERRNQDLQNPILNELKSHKNGILKFGQTVLEISEGEVKTDHEEIPADLVFVATGFKPNTQMFEKYMLNELDSGGHVRVNETLQMENHPHIFIAGDIVNIPEEKLAQCANDHAEDIVHNIKNILTKTPLKKYKAKPRGYLIYLGKKTTLTVGDKQLYMGKLVNSMKYYGYSYFFKEYN